MIIYLIMANIFIFSSKIVFADNGQDTKAANRGLVYFNALVRDYDYLVCQLNHCSEAAEARLYWNALIGLAEYFLIICKHCNVLQAQENLTIYDFIKKFGEALLYALLYACIVVTWNIAIIGLFSFMSIDGRPQLGCGVTIAIGIALSVILPIFPPKAKFLIAMTVYLLLGYTTGFLFYKGFKLASTLYFTVIILITYRYVLA